MLKKCCAKLQKLFQIVCKYFDFSHIMVKILRRNFVNVKISRNFAKLFLERKRTFLRKQIKNINN